MNINLEKMLEKFCFQNTCPDECSPIFVITGKDLFPFQRIYSNQEKSEVEIGYRCPYCGNIVSCESRIPKALKTYIKENIELKVFPLN